MKKLFVFIFVLLFNLGMICETNAASKVRAFEQLAGGCTNCLDNVSPSTPVAGDIAFTLDDSAAEFYIHYFITGSCSSEDSPEIIVPDGCTNEGYWKLVSVVALSTVALGSSDPEAYLNDSNAAGADLADRRAGGFKHNMTTTTEDGEYSDGLFFVMRAGNDMPVLLYDVSDNVMHMGVLPNSWTVTDVADYESLECDFDVTIDGLIECTSVSSSTLYLNLPVNMETDQINCDQLNDTTTPHLLTAREVSGTILSNYDSSPEAKQFDLPVAAEGYAFILALGLAQNVIIHPDGTDVIYLNGTALDGGDKVSNTSPTIGESITCYTIQTGASAWGWICKSGDTDFVDGGA